MPLVSRCLMLLVLVVGGACWAATAPGVTVTMAARGNVRYGPNKDAPIVTTLSPGAEVVVVNQVGTEWYAIQFPRQGHAWMHAKVLGPTDDPRRLRVLVDQAHVRADSRIKAELVAQLDRGEIVEWVGAELDGVWQGRKIGDWYAVYPPSAVAYCHASVLALTTEQTAATQANAYSQHAAEQAWQKAKATYAECYAALQRDQQAGLRQDWESLARTLQDVVAGHPRLRTRLDAEKLLRVIRRVQAASTQAAAGGSAVTLMPEPEPVVAEQPPQVPEQPAVTAPPVVEEIPVAPTAEEPTGTVALPAPVAVAEPAGSSGWLMQRDVPGGLAKHVLIDADSRVTALIAGGAVAEASFSDYFWRKVGVSGPTRTVVVALDGVEQSVPLIEAAAIRMVP